jgi:hypothetical protein
MGQLIGATLVMVVDQGGIVCLANCNFASHRACHNVTCPRCMLFIAKALSILAKHRSKHGEYQAGMADSNYLGAEYFGRERKGGSRIL